MRGGQQLKKSFLRAIIVIMVIAAALSLAGCVSAVSSNSSSTMSTSATTQEANSEEASGDSERRAANEKIAIEFMYAFYNDWDFKDGDATYSTEAFNRRSLPYVAERTALHDELSKDNSFGVGSESRFARIAALHAAEVKPVMRADNVCVVEVSYCGTQNNVTQEWYDDMMKRLSTATWTLVFDGDSKIIAMEEGNVAKEFTRDTQQTDAASESLIADEDVYLGVNRAISLYVEMATNIDWQSGSVSSWNKWKSFEASSETPERLAMLAFTYLYRHDHVSIESCEMAANEIGAYAPENAKYNVRVKLATLENAVKYLYGIEADLTTVTAAGQWGDPHYHDGYVYFYVTNGVSFLAGAALADSIKANGNGTYQVRCGIYSNNTGNTFDFEDDSVYSATPNDLMQRYGDVERVTNASAIVELEDDGRWTLKEFSNGLPQLSNSSLDFSGGKSIDLNWGWDLFNRDAAFTKRSSYDENLAKAAAYLCDGTYQGKGEIENRMRILGFSDPVSEYFEGGLEANTSPMTVASDVATIDGDEYLIVAVAVRGTNDPGDFITDLRSGVFNVDGFSEAGEAGMAVVRDYCESRQRRYGVDANHTILFVTGHSLGAAIAGQIGGNLENEIANRGKIFTYTFASPYYETHGKNGGDFTNIHNVVNSEDAVPKFPLGGQRYGIDHSFRGSGKDVLDQHMLSTYLDGILDGVSGVDSSGGGSGR